MENKAVGVTAFLATMLLALLPLPHLLSLYEDQVEGQTWGFAVRVATFVLILANGLLGAIALRSGFPRLVRLVLRTQSRALAAVALSLVCYNALFGLRVAATTICSGSLSTVCMEPAAKTCAVRRAKSWESALFSFTLCALLGTLAIACSCASIGSAQNGQLSEAVPAKLNATSDFTSVEVGTGHAVSLYNVPRVERDASHGILIIRPAASRGPTTAFLDAETT